MSDRNFKEIRKQLRSVVKEIIDDVLSTELVAAVEKKVQQEVQKRLDSLFEQHAFAMKQFDERLKDTQAYIIRNSATPTTKPTEQATPLPQETL